MNPDPDEIQRMLAHDADMRALARRLVSDPDDADDVTQDAWLVSQSRHPPAGRPVFGWLARIVGNVSLHLGRAGARRDRRERAAAREEALPSTADAVQRVELRRHLIEAVLALDEPLRSTVILRYFEDQQPRRIAARFRIPVETVRSRLKRAHSLLRAKLDEGHGANRSSWLVPLASIAGVRIPVAVAAGAASSTAGAGTLAIGALIMNAKWALASLVVLLMVGSGWLVWRRSTDDQGSAVSRSLALVGETRSMDKVAAAASTPAPASAASRVAIAPRPFRETVDDVVPQVGTVVAKVLWQSDRTPAADLRVRLIPSADPAGVDAAVFAKTDANGVCRFDRVLAGKVGLSVIPNGWKGSEVKPGEVVEVPIEIPEGTIITGSVVNAAHVAVEGAEIWLSEDVTAWDGAVVARSGPGGKFQIRGVRHGEDRHIGARAAGQAAGLLHRVRWQMNDMEVVLLVLGESPGTVRGRVVRLDGSPVANATIFAGAPGFEQPAQHEDPHPKSPTFRVLSDSGGTFQLEGLPVGEESLIIRARGLPLWRRLIMVSPGAQDLEVVIANGATVVGEVIDEAGRPVGGIGVRRQPLHGWLSPKTRTGADGRFRLEGLEPGSIELAASGGDAVGTASATASAEAGQEVSVRIVLPRGKAIFGRVVDERGAPIPSCRIIIEGWMKGASDYRGVTAGKDGTFTFPQCNDIEYPLRVLERDAGIESLRLEKVRPGPDALVLKIPDSARAKGFITGTFTDADGVALKDATVALSNGTSGPPTRCDPDGSFRAGPMPSGTYRLTVSIPGPRLPVYDAPVEVGIGQTHDLGRVRIMNRVVLRLARDDGRALEDMEATLELGSSLVRLGIQDGVAKSQPLPAGSYELRIQGHDVMRVHLPPVEVRLGEEIQLELELRVGGRQVLEFIDERGTARASGIHVAVREQTGALVEDLSGHWDLDGPFDWPIALAAGSYRVEVAWDPQGRYETTFTVPVGSGPNPKPFVFTLK